MRTRIIHWVLLGLVSALLLAGCSRDRLRSQGGQTSAGDNNAPAAAQQTLPTLIQPTTEATTLQPTSVPPQPTLTAAAAAQPTAGQGDASSADISQAADELTNLMNGLTKDLDSTDTLDDVK